MGCGNRACCLDPTATVHRAGGRRWPARSMPSIRARTRCRLRMRQNWRNKRSCCGAINCPAAGPTAATLSCSIPTSRSGNASCSAGMPGCCARNAASGCVSWPWRRTRRQVRTWRRHGWGCERRAQPGRPMGALLFQLNLHLHLQLLLLLLLQPRLRLRLYRHPPLKRSNPQNCCAIAFCRCWPPGQR